MVCDFKIRNVEDTNKELPPKKKLWKLCEGSIRSDFSSYVKELRENSEANLSVEGCWKVLTIVLPETTNRTLGWIKNKLDIKKPGGGMTLLITVLMKSKNHENNTKSET